MCATGRSTDSRIVREKTCKCCNLRKERVRSLTPCDYRKVFISFGGLLLYMEGPYKKLTPLRIDYAYLLIRKS